MRIDVSGRQSGKTHRMIQWMRDNEDAIMIVFSDAEAKRLIDTYDPDHIFGLWNRIVSLHAYQKSPQSFFRPVIGVDNAEFILQALLGNVQYITMSDRENYTI